MPREALLFLVIIVAVVGIAIIIYIASSGKEENDETPDAAPVDVPDPFDDPDCQTRDTLDENNARLESEALDIDIEIARKKAELARLEAAVDAAAQPAPRKKKKHGCLSTICSVFFMVVIFAVVSGNDSDNNGANSTYTNRPKATATATVRPDYYSLPIENAVSMIAEAAQTNDCTTRSVSYYPDMIEIEVNMKNRYDTQLMLNSAIAYSMKAFPMFFEHPDSPQVRFTFWEPGRDKYGNPIDMCTISMRLERETYEKINWAFYKQNQYTHVKNYLDILDGHSLYKDYKAVLEK